MEDGDQFANCKWGEKKIIKETIKKAAPASASSSMRTPVSEPLFVKPRREAEKKKTHMRGGSSTKGEKHQLAAPAEKVFGRKRKYIFLPRVS